jgi:hypothetical protein
MTDRLEQTSERLVHRLEIKDAADKIEIAKPQAAEDAKASSTPKGSSLKAGIRECMLRFIVRMYPRTSQCHFLHSTAMPTCSPH